MNEVNGGGCKVLVVPREESGRCNADAEEFIVLMSKIALLLYLACRLNLDEGRKKSRKDSDFLFAPIHSFINSVPGYYRYYMYCYDYYSNFDSVLITTRLTTSSI